MIVEAVEVGERPALAEDAGTVLTVPLNKSAKVTLQLAAYSGTSATDPVASATGAIGASAMSSR